MSGDSTPETTTQGASESAGSTATPAQGPRRTRRAPWSLKELMLVVVLGVVFGFLYWALVQGWIAFAAVTGPFGDLTQHVLLGGWLIVAPVAIAIVQRPGAGIVAEVLASVIEVVFLGSAVGPLLFVAAAIQGAGSELPFTATRYRSYSWLTYAVSGGLGAFAVFFFSAFRAGWYGTDLFWTRLAIQVVSGVVLGGLLAKVVVDALARTGVVDSFAIGRTASR
jgi:energy-coupling factor transport system substrate-specific component